MTGTCAHCFAGHRILNCKACKGVWVMLHSHEYETLVVALKAIERMRSTSIDKLEFIPNQREADLLLAQALAAIKLI